MEVDCGIIPIRVTSGEVTLARLASAALERALCYNRVQEVIAMAVYTDPDVLTTDECAALTGRTIKRAFATGDEVIFHLDDESRFEAHGYQDDGFGVSYEPSPTPVPGVNFILAVVEECLHNMLHTVWEAKQSGDVALLERQILSTRNYLVDAVEPPGTPPITKPSGYMAVVKDILSNDPF